MYDPKWMLALPDRDGNRRIGDPPVYGGPSRLQDCDGSVPYRTACLCPCKFFVPLGAGFQEMVRPCGKCSHCRWVWQQKLANDVAMEIATSDFSIMMTLTIDPKKVTEANEDRVLDIRLIQKLLKRLRINAIRGHGSFTGLGPDACELRYVQVGEYGSLRGRAHYHLLLFFKGKSPNFPFGDRVHIPEWELGHVNIQRDIDGSAGFYIAKYMSKDYGNEAVFSRSCRPAIGSEYCRAFVFQMVTALQAPSLPHNWSIATPTAGGWRRGLVRGSKRRDMVLEWCRLTGRHISDLYALMPPSLHPAIRQADRYQRERAQSVLPLDDFIAVFREELHSGQVLADLSKERQEFAAVQERLEKLPWLVSDRDWLPVRDNDPADKRAFAVLYNSKLVSERLEFSG